jgi:16S rRNA C1402 (ribose-2'-O) methylase RsmI
VGARAPSTYLVLPGMAISRVLFLGFVKLEV